MEYRPMEIAEPLRDGKKSGYCTNRSRLEQILFGVVVTVTVIALILMILVIKKSSHVEPAVLSTDVCRTSTCIQEAARILRRIDTNVNPCDDFYLFACGNFLKESHGNRNLDDFEQIKNRRKFQLLEMYAEDIRDDDHKMVKSAKKLFRKCLNVTEIEEDKDLTSIKDVLEEIGGWPVLYSGNKYLNWNEENFDWLKATYKLRELGYPFSMFLGLKIQKNENNKEKHIFKVELPHRFDTTLLSKYSQEHTISIMTEIAMLFGSQDRNLAYKQMNETYHFWQDQQINPLNYYYDEDTMTTIADFQKQYGNTFNWLEFINNIAGPTAQILTNDYVLIKGAGLVYKWINFIARTPKRILANYMMWKVIEEQLPYLTIDVRNLNTKREDDDLLAIFTTPDKTRAEFCLTEIQKRFIVSPIQIMYARRYLPLGKGKQIEEIMSKIKLELVNLLKKANWMEKRDKQITLEKAEAISIVVGLPGNYFDDKMLDALGVDMVASKTNTFLNLLAQANRNYQTSIYNLIKMPASENLLDIYYMQGGFSVPLYDSPNNMVFMPVIATQEISFQGSRPNYLNYGLLGKAFDGFLGQFVDPYLTIMNKDSDTELWSNKTKQTAEKMGPCLTDQCKLDYVHVYFNVDLGLGEEMSYAAYEKWSKIKGEEQKLFGLDYSPRQLFWITNTHCRAANNYSIQYYSSTFADYDPIMASQRHTCSIKSNSFYFATDFDCPVESKMNPATKCKLW